MIAFWVNRDGGFGVRNYRSHRGAAIADHFETLVYEDLGRDVVVPAGPQIFAALDQATEAQQDAVAQVWDAHAQALPGAWRLNDPRRVLLRFELLAKLHEVGLNSFRVYRTDKADDVERFPVFVRHIHRHDGPQTRLVQTRDELRRLLLALRIRGRRLRDHMIVEFCDASGPDGLFRKYAAFKIGSRIIPCHVFASHDWCVKSQQNEPTEASLDEGLRYQIENPHDAWLRRIFDVAGIDYGRIDYGVSRGVPQAWEINLNPTIGRAAGQSKHAGLAAGLKALRDRGREIFHDELRSAFLALDDGAQGGHVRVTLDTPVVLRLQRDTQQRQRRRRLDDWLGRLYASPGISRPVRALYSLLPRR